MSRLSQYNHQKTINRINESGFSARYLRTELRVLALYYREQGHPPKKRRELLYEECEKHIKDFNRVKLFKAINSAVNYSSNRKNRFIVIDSVSVSQSELNFIDELDIDYNYKKILFTMVVMDKLSKERYKIIANKEPNEEHYFGNPPSKYTELMKTSTVSRGSFKKNGHVNIHDVIRYFSEIGLVQVNMGIIKLLFMYDMNKSEDEEVVVKDYENIGLYYDLYSGVKNIKECESCEVIMKVRSNRAKYCKPCANEVERIRKRNWSRENSELEKRQTP